MVLRVSTPNLLCNGWDHITNISAVESTPITPDLHPSYNPLLYHLSLLPDPVAKVLGEMLLAGLINGAPTCRENIMREQKSASFIRVYIRENGPK